MMMGRNRTTHLYDEAQAREVYEKIVAKHEPLLRALRDKVEKDYPTESEEGE